MSTGRADDEKRSTVRRLAVEYDGDVARLPLAWVLCCDLEWEDDGLGHRWQVPKRWWIEDERGHELTGLDFAVRAAVAKVPSLAAQMDSIEEMVRITSSQAGATR